MDENSSEISIFSEKLFNLSFQAVLQQARDVCTTEIFLPVQVLELEVERVLLLLR